MSYAVLGLGADPPALPGTPKCIVGEADPRFPGLPQCSPSDNCTSMLCAGEHRHQLGGKCACVCDDGFMPDPAQPTTHCIPEPDQSEKTTAFVKVLAGSALATLAVVLIARSA